MARYPLPATELGLVAFLRELFSPRWLPVRNDIWHQLRHFLWIVAGLLVSLALWQWQVVDTRGRHILDLSFSGESERTVAQGLYETTSLVVGITAIIVIGISIAVPVIILSWSQVIDSIFTLLVRVNTELKNDLGETATKRAAHLAGVLEDIWRVNRIARPTLLGVLLVSLSILLLAFGFPFVSRGVDYYEFLGLILLGLTLLTALTAVPLLCVIILLMSRGALSAKADTQLAIVADLRGCPMPPNANATSRIEREHERGMIECERRSIFQPVQLAVAASMGVLIYLANLVTGTLIVEATGIPFAGAFVMFFLFPIGGMTTAGAIILGGFHRRRDPRRRPARPRP